MEGAMRRLALLAMLVAWVLPGQGEAQKLEVKVKIRSVCKVEPQAGQTCEEAVSANAAQQAAPRNQQENPQASPRSQQENPPRPPQRQQPDGSRVRPNEPAGVAVPAPRGGEDTIQRPARAEPAPVIGRPSNLFDRTQRFQQQLLEIEAAQGRGVGAPNADRYFDQQGRVRGTGIDSVTQPARDPTFRGSGIAVDGGLRPTPPEMRRQIEQKFGGTIPGGVVLEGSARLPYRVNSVEYDARLNAILINDEAGYFFPIPPRSVMNLSGALALSDLVGVSLGDVHLVYGAVPADSEVAVDLKLADKFLGDIVFARNDWTAGYRFANGYAPQSQQVDSNLAVFFSFNGFEFGVADQEIGATRANFDVRVIPLAAQTSAEGGHRADLSSQETFYQYEENARHVGSNVGYYRNERIIHMTFAYAEVAAFLRALKTMGVDLGQFARAVHASNGFKTPLAFSVAPDAAKMRQPVDSLFEAWRRLDLSGYLAQWAPDAVKFEKGKRSSLADIRRNRESLFPRITAVEVNYGATYRGYNHGIGRFDVKYALGIRLESGKTVIENECEIYKVRRQGGRWVIVENRDYVPCQEIDDSIKAEWQQRERRTVADWTEYLKAIQSHNRYANWTAPPYDLFSRRAR
jgi:hypothetical protein